MFENLTEKLQRAFKNLRGQGTLSEENIGEALKCRVAMVAPPVARILGQVQRQRAVGPAKGFRRTAVAARIQSAAQGARRCTREASGQAGGEDEDR